MSQTPCDCLNDYLDHDLAAEAEQFFLMHLPACAACSAAVAEQRRLEADLSGAVERFDRPPGDLVEKTRKRIRRASRCRFIAYAAVSSAAAAALIWGTINFLQLAPGPLPPLPAPPISIAENPPSSPEVRVTFANESKLLVVPEKTDSPDVTFLWVFSNQRETH